MNKIDVNYIIRWAKKIKAINLLGGKCVKCGIDSPFVLQFHHKDSEIKDQSINKMLRVSKWEDIDKEARKCILLCANCHHEHHYMVKTSIESKRRDNKNIFLEYIGYDYCRDCGYKKCDQSLSFHHINRKTFNINDICKRYTNINDLCRYVMKELDECIVLCMNCHMKTHVDVQRFNKYENEILEKAENLRCIKKADHELIGQLLKDGKTYNEITIITGCSKGHISYIKNKILKI